MKKKTLLSGALFLTATGLATQTLGFIYRIAITRLTTSEELGLYQLIMPFYSAMTAFCYSGLTVAVAKIVSEKHAEGDVLGEKETVSSAVKIFFSVSALVSVAVAAAAGPAASHLIGDVRTEKALFILIPCMILTGIENISKNYFYGIGELKTPAVCELLEQSVRIFAVTALLVLFSGNGEGAATLIAEGMTLCEIVSAVTLTFLRVRHIRKRLEIGKTKKSGRSYKKLLAVAVPVALGNFSGAMMDSFNASLIPKRLEATGMSREAAVSLFGETVGMSLPLLSLSFVFIGALCTVLMPAVASLHAKRNEEELRIKLSKAFSFAAIVIFPVTAFLVPLGPYIGEFVFGNADVGKNLLPHAVCTALIGLQAVTASAAYGLGHQRVSTVGFIIGDYIQLAFTYFLCAAPQIGIYGYLAGLAASAAFTLTLNTVAVLKTAKMRFEVKNWLLKPFALAVGAYGVSKAAVLFFTVTERAMLPAAAGLCLLFAAVFGLLAFRFASKEGL